MVGILVIQHLGHEVGLLLAWGEPELHSESKTNFHYLAEECNSHPELLMMEIYLLIYLGRYVN